MYILCHIHVPSYKSTLPRQEQKKNEKVRRRMENHKSNSNKQKKMRKWEIKPTLAVARKVRRKDEKMSKIKEKQRSKKSSN